MNQIEGIDPEDLKRYTVGVRIIDALNYPLFNSPPNKHKGYWIYKALLEAGYREKDYNIAYQRICEFYERRTIKNQAQLFVSIFNIKPNSQVFATFALDFRQAEVSEKKITQAADYIFRQLQSYADPVSSGLTSIMVYATLKLLYKPSHHEVASNFDLGDFISRMKRYLSYQEHPKFDSILNYLYVFNPKGNEQLVREKLEAKIIPPETPAVGGSGDGAVEIQKSGSHLNHQEAKLTVSINQWEYEWLKRLRDIVSKPEALYRLPDLKSKDPFRLPAIRKIITETRIFNQYLQKGQKDQVEKLRGSILVSAEALVKPHEFHQQKMAQELKAIQDRKNHKWGKK